MENVEANWKKLDDAVCELQAQSIVRHHIIRELLVSLAKASPDPDQAIREISERVGAALDFHETDGFGKHPKIDAAIRFHQDKMFSDAAEQVRRITE